MAMTPQYVRQHQLPCYQSTLNDQTAFSLSFSPCGLPSTMRSWNSAACCRTEGGAPLPRHLQRPGAVYKYWVPPRRFQHVFGPFRHDTMVINSRDTGVAHIWLLTVQAQVCQRIKERSLMPSLSYAVDFCKISLQTAASCHPVL